MRVLVIEDDMTIQFGLNEYFHQNYPDWDWQRAYTIQEADSLINQDFNLAIVDAGLPDGSGFDFSQKLMNKGIPFIFLTAKDEEKDIVRGFDLGAQDYLSKPFGLKELERRILRILKQSSTLVSYQNLKINTQRARVLLDDEEIYLSVLEYRLLLLLVQNQEKLLTRDFLSDNLGIGAENNLSITIKRLRQKLEPHICIQTVHGQGYKLS